MHLDKILMVLIIPALTPAAASPMCPSLRLRIQSATARGTNRSLHRGRGRVHRRIGSRASAHGRVPGREHERALGRVHRRSAATAGRTPNATTSSTPPSRRRKSQAPITKRLPHRPPPLALPCRRRRWGPLQCAQPENAKGSHRVSQKSGYLALTGAES